jgi:agmatinase
MTFLAARPAPVPREGKGAAVIVGVPFDATSTFRRGSSHGPAAIRWASQSIETYSPVLRRDLEDIELFEGGDVDVTGADVDAMRAATDAHLAGLAAHAVPVVLGGEHTVSLPVVERLHRSYADLAVLQLDAHTDLRDEYEGLGVSHATVMRRIADIVGFESIVQLGTRAGTAGEFETARQSLRYSSPTLTVPPEIWSWLEQRPVYVTLDIDVVDPSDAPGTGNPEPEGVTAGELLAFVRKLGTLRVVGLDVMEVSPPYDSSGRTAVLAATIVREAILVISAKPL